MRKKCRKCISRECGCWKNGLSSFDVVLKYSINQIEFNPVVVFSSRVPVVKFRSFLADEFSFKGIWPKNMHRLICLNLTIKPGEYQIDEVDTKMSSANGATL